jgi:hypothetical protein
MPVVEYDPDFQPPAYQDGRDRVKAGGPRGFNEVFDSLRHELDTISDVIKAIKAELERLAQRPAPTEQKTTLTPTLVTVGSDAWSHIVGGVTKPPAPATAANGMMSLELPQGARIRSLRAIGENTGPGALDIILRRQGLAAGANAQLIVAVGGTGGTFDTTNAAPATEIAKVDNEQFRYFVSVELDSANSGDTVRVSAIQVAHIAE